MTSDHQRMLRDLPDDRVIDVLALLLDARSRLPDAAAARQITERLNAVNADPTPLRIVDEWAEPGESSSAEASLNQLATKPTPDTDTVLARTALDYLIETDPLAAETLPRAIRLAADNHAGIARFDPLTLTVGGLVLAVLQTEVDWTRSDTGRWKLRIHKRAMRDSTIATLIRGVLHPAVPDAKGPSEQQ